MRVIENDPYSKGDSDFSATGLANPPRAIVLMAQHGKDLEIDISTRVAATIGQGVHSVLERGERPGIDIIERRFFHYFIVDEISYTVSAQIDLYEGDTQTLYDWKTTKAFAFHKKTGAKPEWAAQMNIGSLLMKWNGIDVQSLTVVGLLKDWDYKKASEEPGYPETEIVTREISLWEEEKTVNYITTRINAIVAARENLPECTKSETWGGNRCSRYCDVASVCEQYKRQRVLWPS
jgi:hypothetical protein